MSEMLRAFLSERFARSGPILVAGADEFDRGNKRWVAVVTKHIDSNLFLGRLVIFQRRALSYSCCHGPLSALE